MPEDILESIAIAGVCSNGQRNANLSNLSFSNVSTNVNLSQQNSLSIQQSINQIALAATGKAVNLVSNLLPLEANAVVKLDTGNDLAQQIAGLRAAVEGIGPTTTPSGSSSSTSSDSSLSVFPFENPVFFEGNAAAGSPPTVLPPGVFELENGQFEFLG